MYFSYVLLLDLLLVDLLDGVSRVIIEVYAICTDKNDMGFDC
jgi:hypothetical protein